MFLIQTIAYLSYQGINQYINKFHLVYIIYNIYYKFIKVV